ncbi:MAG: GDP-L-fucose synthase [Magnetococcus sp. XQGC-1]
MVGSAIVRRLKRNGFKNLLLRTRAELDLTNQQAVNQFFAQERPDLVFLAAGKVGGIHANNTYPADFIRDNLLIQAHIIAAAYDYGCKKLQSMGSSCIYPREAPQPITEDALLTAPLEATNQWYAVAKIAAIKMCQAYQQQYGFNTISLMPTNLYGPEDNYHLENSHVLPALLRRFHEAHIHGLPQVTVWGTGTPRREFLHVDDLADAALFLMEHYEGQEIVNVGTGRDISIRALAELIREIVGYKGDIVFDSSKPDGTALKMLDVSRLAKLGWRAQISFRDGLQDAYRWFVEHQESIRR